jgi:hypothetical protein
MTGDFFQELARNKRTPPPANPGRARKIGSLLGGLIGLAYGFVSQSINSLYLPQVAFAHYPFGYAGNILAWTMGGSLVGLACAWPRETVAGGIRGSVAFTCLFELRIGLVQIPQLMAGAGSILSLFNFLTLGLVLIFSIPLTLLLRVAVEIQNDYADKKWSSWIRLRAPVALLVLAVSVAAIFYRYPSDVLKAMDEINTSIQDTLAANSPDAVPAALRTEGQFIQEIRASKPAYTIELGDYFEGLDDQAVLPDAFVILARFNDGWTLACQYERQATLIDCKSFPPKSAPGITDYRTQASAPRQ